MTPFRQGTTVGESERYKAGLAVRKKVLGEKYVNESLAKEIGEAVGSADYREKMAALDMQPRASTSQELAGYLKADLAKWAKVVKEAGIKPE